VAQCEYSDYPVALLWPAQIPELDARLAAKQTERDQQKRERAAAESAKMEEYRRLERDADELRKALARVMQYRPPQSCRGLGLRA
jgi:hypothetical protein